MTALNEVSPVPTLKEELTRKTLEAMGRLGQDRENGKIGSAQYNYAIDILWETVAGLIPVDVQEIVALMRDNKFDEKEVLKKHFLSSNGRLTTIARYPRDERVEVTMTDIKNGQVTTCPPVVREFLGAIMGCRKSLDFEKQLRDRLVMAGCKEL